MSELYWKSARWGSERLQWSITGKVRELGKELFAWPCRRLLSHEQELSAIRGGLVGFVIFFGQFHGVSMMRLLVESEGVCLEQI